MTPAETLAAKYRAHCGREAGVSGWITVDQTMIDRFADVTQDLQFIHVDPARAAAETPFGGTVAHGFLTLSLASHFAQEALAPVPGAAMSLNYGFERVRFPSPVRSGARVRGRFVLTAVTARAATQVMHEHRLTVEIDGQDRPALVADWLTLTDIATDR